jgi:Fe-S cluster biogenesis protein NfuA
VNAHSGGVSAIELKALEYFLKDLFLMSTLALTNENVEKVLDDLRPYLMADGGNVELVELDGPVVKLRLQGACGSCPSSAMTLRMGIERRLREFIPEIAEVEQVV